ncbi:hypothetical protein Trydic_g12891 [Trypoxylus dichotomus]
MDEPKTEEYMEQTKRHKKRRVDSKPKESQSIPTLIQAEPATEEDYGKLSKMLKKEGIQIYTFQLKSEKKLKVIHQGITQDITDDEIKDDLQQQDYSVQKNFIDKG